MKNYDFEIIELEKHENYAFLKYGKHTLLVEFESSFNCGERINDYDGIVSETETTADVCINEVYLYNENWDYSRIIKVNKRFFRQLEIDLTEYLEESFYWL
jgi:hypothetical protein